MTPTSLPSAPGSQTSQAAAEQYQPRAKGARARVLECIRLAGLRGLTDEQISELTGIPPNTCRPRRVELAGGDGYPPRIARQGTRETRSGAKADVWVAIEYLRGTQLELVP